MELVWAQHVFAFVRYDLKPCKKCVKTDWLNVRKAKTNSEQQYVVVFERTERNWRNYVRNTLKSTEMYQQIRTRLVTVFELLGMQNNQNHFNRNATKRWQKAAHFHARTWRTNGKRFKDETAATTPASTATTPTSSPGW